MSQTILITGATGKQGGETLRYLQSHAKNDNIHYRALTRNPDSPSAQKLASKGIELVKGDLSDAASLRNALQDVTSAFLVTDPTGKGGATAEAEKGKTFVDAAKEAGVRYVVFTSVGGAERRTGVPHFDSKFEVEQHLRASGMACAIIRPVAFMDNFTKEPSFLRFMVLGLFTTALRGKKIQLVASEDIGIFAGMALLDQEKYQGQEIELAGDDLTMTQVLDVYEKVQGVRPWKAWLPYWFVYLLPEDARKMFIWFLEAGYEAPIQELKQTYSGLQNLEMWLRK